MKIFEESAGQKENFRTAANRLLNGCFLLKNKPESRKDYFFVLQNKEEFAAYFDLLNYEVLINEGQGVIGLVNREGTGRISLSKYESIVLLILRWLYLERRRQLDTYAEEVTISLEDIREKYAILKIKAKPSLDKTTETQCVRLFGRYNIIQRIDEDTLVIYQSILMAVPGENISNYLEETKRKLEEYAGGQRNEHL